MTKPLRQGFLVCVRPVRENPALDLHVCAGGCGHPVTVSHSEENLLSQLPYMEIRCLECIVKHLLADRERSSFH